MMRGTSLVWKAIIMIVLIQQPFVKAQLTKTTPPPATKSTNAAKTPTTAPPIFTKTTLQPATKSTVPLKSTNTAAPPTKTTLPPATKSTTPFKTTTVTPNTNPTPTKTSAAPTITTTPIPTKTSAAPTKTTNPIPTKTSAAPTKTTNRLSTKTTLSTVVNTTPLSTPSSQCKTLGGKRCIFPYTYEARTYSGCTDVDDDRFWCATSVDQNGFVLQFDYCSTSCPVATIPPSAVCQTLTGYDCILPFFYCGIEYKGCTGKDNLGIGWCATSVTSNGETITWDECTDTCPKA